MTGRAVQPWAWNSLRLRLLLAIAAWVALGIGGVWFSATRLFSRHVEQQYHEELEVHVRELADLVRVGADGTVRMTRPLSDPRYQVPLSGFYWQVSVDGHPPLRSASMARGSLDERIAHSAHVLHRTEHGPTGPAITYGFVGRGPSGQDIHYLIATDQRLLDAAIGNFTRELGGWLAVLSLALLVTGWAVAAFGFRPLGRLARAVAALREGGNEEVAGRFPGEIAPLVDELNSYIRHTAAIVQRGRAEAGNLAHGLRTPLAVITDEAEQLAQAPDTAASAAVLLHQADLMARQIEFRLARVRTAAGVVPGSASRVADVLSPILSAMRRLHPQIAFDVDGRSAPDVTLPIDPVNLAELLSNVLDNAGKWATGQVRVVVQGGACPKVVIRDDGPGMTAEQIRDAGQIAVRFDESRPGSGLGLAIAMDIAQSCGITLALRPRPDGQSGLEVEIGGRPA